MECGLVDDNTITMPRIIMLAQNMATHQSARKCGSQVAELATSSRKLDHLVSSDLPENLQSPAWERDRVGAGAFRVVVRSARLLRMPQILVDAAIGRA